MPIKDRYCVVLCTCVNDEHAERLARSLVENRLAACVQICPIRSVYEWKGEILQADERLLLIKSKSVLFSKIEGFITKNHPYEVPEVVRIPITEGHKGYLDWIDSVVR